MELKSPRVLRSQEGFGLIEMVISFGLMGLLALGIATTVDQIHRSQAQALAKLGTMTLQQDLRTQLQDVFCSSSLKPVGAVNPASPLHTTVILGKGAVGEGSSMQDYGGIVVHHFQLENFKLEGVIPPGNNNIYSTDLMLGTKSASGQFFKTAKVVRLLITTDPAGTFIKCSSAEVAMTCVGLGGTFDPTATPACTLPSDNAQNCAALGGTYNPAASPPCSVGETSAQSCANVGGTYNPAASPPCTLSTGTPTPVARLCDFTNGHGPTCCNTGEISSCAAAAFNVEEGGNGGTGHFVCACSPP